MTEKLEGSEDRMAGDRLDLDAILAEAQAVLQGYQAWNEQRACIPGANALNMWAARLAVALRELVAARAVPDPREAAPQSVVDIFRILNADRDRYKAERDVLRAAIEKFTAPMDKTTRVEYGPGWYELRAAARDSGAPHPEPRPYPLTRDECPTCQAEVRCNVHD